MGSGGLATIPPNIDLGPFLPQGPTFTFRMPDDDPIRRTIACHSAVKAGETLNREQMEQIIERLKETQHPLTCPHGRPTGIMISMNELARRCLRS